eukprot:5836992-Amphidinium_carterae.1
MSQYREFVIESFEQGWHDELKRRPHKHKPYQMQTWKRTRWRMMVKAKPSPSGRYCDKRLAEETCTCRESCCCAEDTTPSNLEVLPPPARWRLCSA